MEEAKKKYIKNIRSCRGNKRPRIMGLVEEGLLREGN